MSMNAELLRLNAIYDGRAEQVYKLNSGARQAMEPDERGCHANEAKRG